MTETKNTQKVKSISELVLELKQERKKQGLTQKQLAEKAGYKSYMSIARIENGPHIPSVNILANIAKALGLETITVTYFERAG